MAKRQVVSLNTSTPQLVAPQTGDTYQLVRDVFLTTGVMKSEAADGASAVGFVFDTENSFANASAKIASFKNAGTEKAYIDKAGLGVFDSLKTSRADFPAVYFNKVGSSESAYIYGSSQENGDLVFGLGTNGTVGNNAKLVFGTTQLKLNSAYSIGWTSGGFNDPRDSGLKRTGAGIVGITNGSTGGGAIGMQEQTAPSAPAANGVYIYAQDNGAGKTQLMALFASGAAQQIAIEP